MNVNNTSVNKLGLKDKLKTLPLKPGCYLMKDKTGKIIYVGKAIKLKNRVNSYFRGAHDYKTTKMVSNIADFEYIVTKSEKEALILEYNLIKNYNPKYNIVFKDDKSYPYIELSNDIPYVKVVHKNKKQKAKGKLFGPYPDVFSARNTVKLINRIFNTRKCKNLGKELCLYYHINSCPGYCVKDVDQETINKIKNDVTSFLNGDTKDIINELKEKMNNEADNLNFERANEYKLLIDDIKQLALKQDVQINSNESFDVFNYYSQDGYICIVGLFIRNGKIIGKDSHIDYLVGDEINYVSSYIYQFYDRNNSPKCLFVNKELLVYLQDSFEFKVTTVTKGKKYQILKQARNNCIEYLSQNKKVLINKDEYYENINIEFTRIFNKDIHRIELFDNSHMQGTNTIGAMVVYKDFKPCKSEYRHFRLEDSADDLKSMREMLYRHYYRVLVDKTELTDLLIVDGGINQINVAKEIIDSLKLNILLCGLGKNDKHNTSYLMDRDGNIIEIDSKSNLFYMLTNMQDEVHRFAITYHRNLRSKTMYKSIFDDVKGIGPKTKKKLLKKYKTIDELKKLSLDDLKADLNDNIAEKLYNKLREV